MTSLIHEWAVTPQVFLPEEPGSDHALIAFLQGVERNGLLADFEGAELLQSVTDEPKGPPRLGSSLHREIVESIALLRKRNRVVKRRSFRRSHEGEDEWAREIRTSHKQLLPFHGIVLSSTSIAQDLCGNGLPATPLTAVLSSDPWRKCQGSTAIVQKTAEGFKNALSPLLRHATRLTLADPMLFSCLKEGRAVESRFVQGCIAAIEAAAGSRSAPLEVLELHADVRKSSERDAKYRDWREIAGHIERESRRRIPALARFSANLWKTITEGPALHNRYVITNYCAVQLPHGLDVAAPGTVDEWTLLDNEAWEIVSNRFKQNCPAYRLVDEWATQGRRG